MVIIKFVEAISRSGGGGEALVRFVGSLDDASGEADGVISAGDDVDLVSPDGEIEAMGGFLVWFVGALDAELVEVWMLDVVDRFSPLVETGLMGVVSLLAVDDSILDGGDVGSMGFGVVLVILEVDFDDGFNGGGVHPVTWFGVVRFGGKGGGVKGINADGSTTSSAMAHSSAMLMVAMRKIKRASIFFISNLDLKRGRIF